MRNRLCCKVAGQARTLSLIATAQHLIQVIGNIGCGACLEDLHQAVAPIGVEIDQAGVECLLITSFE